MLPQMVKAVVEAPPAVRWHLWRFAGRTLLRRAFRAWGDGTVIVRPLRLRGVERISLGERCAIYENVWLEAGPDGSVEIGDDVYIGHDCHVHALASVAIGDGCMLVDRVLVSDGEHVRQVGWPAQPRGPISIGQRVFIGAGACVLGGVTIGDDATVGAGAVVTRDVPAGVTVAGVPARPV
jgi:acetyltransferase-like isoleucine patch superfamily enzyme